MKKDYFAEIMQGLGEIESLVRSVDARAADHIREGVAPSIRQMDELRPEGRHQERYEAGAQTAPAQVKDEPTAEDLAAAYERFKSKQARK